LPHAANAATVAAASIAIVIPRFVCLMAGSPKINELGGII
jgi:hypothetical protein